MTSVLSSVLLVSLLMPSVSFGAPVPGNKIGVTADGFAITQNYSMVGGQPTAAGSFSNGQLGAYAEGSCIPVLAQVENKDKDDGDITLSLMYDYKFTGNATDSIGIDHLEMITTLLSGNPKTAADNLNDFSFPGGELTSTSFNSSAGSISATISGPYKGNDTGTDAVTDTDTIRHYNMTLTNVPSDQTVYVLFCGRLGPDAKDFPGASMSISTSEGGGNISIQSNNLLALPSLTVTKVVAIGSATPDQWTFSVSPAINNQTTLTIPSGESSVTVDNISPDGNYVITENPGPQGYSFSSGSGTNCSFDGSTATASLTSGSSTTCTFTNTSDVPPPYVATTGTLTVIKTVINDDNGVLASNDFTIHVTGTNPSITDFSGSSSGTVLTLEAGTYAVTEDAVAGYTGTVSADCSGTMTVGGNLTCTITNDDNEVVPPFVSTTGTLTVIKTVVNNNSGEMSASAFALFIDETSVVSGFQNTVASGTHIVSETPDQGYTGTITGDCDANGNVSIAPGDVKTCTITNDDIGPPPVFEATTGTLTVIKNVVNDAGGESSPGSFTMHVTGTSPSLTTFPGSNAGTVVTLGVGSYSVTEDPAGGYTGTLSAECSGSIAAGQNVTCTVINNDNNHLVAKKAGSNRQREPSSSLNTSSTITADQKQRRTSACW